MLVTLFFLLISLHDIPVADFNVYLYEQYGMVEVLLDSEDLGYSMEAQSYQVNKSEIYRYLTNCFLLQLDGKTYRIDYCELTYDGHHVIAKGELAMTKMPTYVSIQLTCLVSETFDQINNVIIHYEDRVRGFKLSKNKTNLSVEL